MSIHIDIVSAEKEIFSGTATMVIAPAEMGEVGIMPQHTPMLTRLKPGSVRVQEEDGREESFYVSGGLLEVQPHIITILADTAQRADDIDEAAALEAKERAEDTIKNQKDKIDYARAQAELAEAIAQIRTIENLRKKLGHRR
ncbi:F0F1 ATP synthase subunit epsilon [Candidatus Nitrosacidococcus sp. I8]|uniref:F0F1 ATP synthase subunit epsilon n=1 Tax=Candidatus Nitrosacidococcus sp. I8 TaxID=2942908 RepID=UPI002225E83A|nr:F0F1 ATP synthase subunit epsilon [Candidatus Nitrosacidococcus sp. I8]CAH9019932.1 ATP synthase epsilon chain [Candidatus Nitrosacidococcus sp. I8]